jgi:hypothetical protein
MATTSLGWQFEFYRAARLLLSRLQVKGHGAVPLRLPSNFPLHRPDGRYEVAALMGWFDAQLNALATRFDARNGNDHFRRRIAELEQLSRQVRPHPLPSRPRKDKPAD